MFRNFKKSWKVALIVLIVAVSVLSLLVPQKKAYAWSLFGTASALTDLLGGVAGWMAFAVNYFVSMIVGLFIAVVTYLIGVILQLNGNVVNSLAVQAGFQMTLAIANLGFVLAIIVIAIATILHQEGYGIKKTLWKLVVAAIIVNFSLIIGGAFLNFSDQLTNVFLSAFPGAGGGVFGFADKLASGFTPQRELLNGFLNPNAGGGNISSGATGGATIGQGAAQLGGQVSSLITPIFSIVFTAGMLIVILITLVVFLFMLFVRYVYLTILLILAPLAWLFWIFPKTKNLFEKWWSTFIRWTFFAPIVVFFLYLALRVSDSMGQIAKSGDPAASLSGLGYQPQAGGIGGAISAFIGGALNTIVGTAAQEFVVVALAVGGMIAANKMSITGAAAGLTAAKAVGNKAKGFAWDRTKQGGRWVGRKAGVDKAVEAMRTGKVGVAPKKLESVPYVGRVVAGANKVATMATSAAGRTLAPHLSNEDLVEKAKKSLPKNAEDIKKDLLGEQQLHVRLASIARLTEMGELDENVKIGRNRQGVKDFLDEHGEDLDNANQEKAKKDADKALFSNKEMRDATREIESLTQNGKDASTAMARLDEATTKFLADLKSGDIAKANVNAAFEKPTVLTKSLIKNLAQNAPQLFPAMLRKAKGKTIASIQDQYNDILASDPNLAAFNQRSQAELQAIHGRSQEYIQRNQRGELKDKELKTYLDQLKREYEEAEERIQKERRDVEAKYNKATFSKIIGNNTLGFGGEESAGGAAPPTPPPSTPSTP